MNNVMAQATNEADTLTPRKQKAYMRTTPGNDQTGEAETSWGQVSDWYDKHLEAEEDTYHRMVILPNLSRLIAPQEGEHILELACGQGFFARRFQEEAKGAVIDGMDISPELIEIAKKRAPKMNFIIGNAEDCSAIADNTYDTVYMVLAIQNVERIDKLFGEVQRILKTGGTFHIVMNHPTFRIPKESSWEYVDEKNVQSRRIDAYLSTSKVAMDMHPGIVGSPQTISFHRPLQTYFKQMTKFGFAIDKLEEWISHKVSDNGPRMDAENRARKEFPLFMYLRAKKLS
jgi:ubiquinone/menaquinone biosynthesis C-methylase UbiE